MKLGDEVRTDVSGEPKGIEDYKIEAAELQAQIDKLLDSTVSKDAIDAL